MYSNHSERLISVHGGQKLINSDQFSIPETIILPLNIHVVIETGRNF